MSAGDAHKSTQAHIEELENIEHLPWFRAGLAIPFAVVTDRRIPFLGGVSVDGTHIYLDAGLPPRVHVAPYGMIDLRPGLIVHERWEGIFMRHGYKYAAAHEFATCAENRVYRAHGFDPAKVQAVYPRLLRASEKQQLEPGDVPADLDLRPYQGTRYLAVTKSAMGPPARPQRRLGTERPVNNQQ
jgi:hypothetical protein